jgi:hypothetical protein
MAKKKKLTVFVCWKNFELVDLSLMNHLIIDCDPGHDDFAMLLLALGSPNVVVRAIVCVHGNQSVSHCVPIH